MFPTKIKYGIVETFSIRKIAKFTFPIRYFVFILIPGARVINKFLRDSRTYVRKLRRFITELFLP